MHSLCQKSRTGRALQSPHHGIINCPRIIHALGSIQNFHTYDIAVFIVVDDHTGFVFIAFFDGGVAKKNAQHIDFGIISDPDGIFRDKGKLNLSPVILTLTFLNRKNTINF
jgi:hypothetical protein